jgi:galactitol-specific phosphotransferase system IIB component
MEYSKLISVSGLPGLFELVSTKNDGAIVRSLEDETTRFVSSRGHQFSHLESIEVYTTGNNVNLADIFVAIKNTDQPLPDVKNEKALKSFFQTVYPEIDLERVYSSDLKKMIKWSQILDKAGVEIKLSEEEAEEADAENTEAEA